MLGRIIQLIERVGIAGAIALFLLWQVPPLREVIAANTEVTRSAVQTLDTLSQRIENQSLELRELRHASESPPSVSARR